MIAVGAVIAQSGLLAGSTATCFLFPRRRQPCGLWILLLSVLRSFCIMSKAPADDPSAPASNGDASKPEDSSSSPVQNGKVKTTSGKQTHEEVRKGLEKMLASEPRPDPKKDDEDKVHKFWSTQPVVQHNQSKELSNLGAGEAIETKTVADVQKEPYPLIGGFEWCDVDVTDDGELEEVYKLLNQNYIEDGEAMFRFDYTREFLKWALLPPGWQKSWHLGVRVKANRKLVAIITAIPARIQLHSHGRDVVEINFLCVHKKLRMKRLAPVLIREITRRVNLQDVWQAVYTAGVVLPRPVTSSHYYHRSLNPKKLIEIGFSRLAPRMTMARTLKLYALKGTTTTPGIRLMEPHDVPEARLLLREYFERFSLHVDFSEDDFRHWLLPREGVVYSYVVEDPSSGKLTDMISFYSLPSSIIKNPNYKILNAAYSFCNAAMKTPIADLMRDALILARQNDFDVFNALDLGENSQFFRDLHFHIGDGKLHYYLYNWKCKPIDNTENALVLL